jgi:hypothetical protein
MGQENLFASNSPSAAGRVITQKRILTVATEMLRRQWRMSFINLIQTRAALPKGRGETNFKVRNDLVIRDSQVSFLPTQTLCQSVTRPGAGAAFALRLLAAGLPLELEQLGGLDDEFWMMVCKRSSPTPR